MSLRDDYILKAFFSGPFVAFGRVILVVAAPVLGQILSIPMFNSAVDFYDLIGFVILIPFYMGLGCFSVVGLIFPLIALSYCYRTWMQDGSMRVLFFVLAACQMGLVLCSFIISGSWPWIPGVIFAVLSLAGLYGLAKLATDYLAKRPYSVD